MKINGLNITTGLGMKDIRDMHLFRNELGVIGVKVSDRYFWLGGTGSAPGSPSYHCSNYGRKDLEDLGYLVSIDEVTVRR